MIFRVLLSTLLTAVTCAAADPYAAADSLAARTKDKVWGDRVEVRFSEGGMSYQVNGAQGPEYFTVDLTTGAKQPVAKETLPAWQPQSLQPTRERRSRANGTATRVTFQNDTADVIQIYWLDPQGQPMCYAAVNAGKSTTQDTYAGHIWQARDAQDQPLGNFAATESPALAIITSKPPPSPAKAKPAAAPPPRGKIRFQDDNAFLQLPGQPEIALTKDGTPQHSYRGPVVWAGTFVALYQVEPVEERLVHYIESSPADQLQPKHSTKPYAKPGDAIDHPRVCLFDSATQRQIPVRDALFPNPWSLDQLTASADGHAFRVLYNQRGHQVLRLLEIEAATGTVRTLAQETPRTFVDYTNKVWHHFLHDDTTLLWMSERDGDNHLYRIDTTTGHTQPLTTGPWMVRKVDDVREAEGTLWFTAMGVRPGQDPYFKHLCRVNLDGSHFTILTEGHGSHHWEFSPDRKYFIDRWSRVDQPTITELRSTADGHLITELAAGNFTALTATGWQAPEPFVAKGRDGTTDIYGIICRPTNYDPHQHYPVVEKIYAGPQDFFVPKEFSLRTHDRELSELGCILVQMDGMGTNWRGKAFHDVCWKNLADAGFPDRIAWLRAAARMHPEMDLSRMGIYGGSAGGQNALRALIDHGDFYHASVADCGCHDNRMDKIWWNEQWMGWPVGPEYEASSNVAQAHKLQGHIFLTWGEMDHNVDPSSSMQVVHALMKAGKAVEMFITPGADHGSGESPYLHHQRMAFFQRWLELGK